MNKLSQNHAVFARADWKAVDADLEYRIDQLRKEIMNKDTEIFQLMKQREELDLQFSCAFKEKEELLNQRNTESHLLKSVGDELASISSQLDASNEVMEIEQDGIKREVDGLREDLAKYKSELSRRQRAVEIMNAQTQHYRNENDRLDGLQTEMEDKCRQLQQKVKDSEKVLGVPIKAIQRTKIELGKGAYGVYW
ncbi:uncharacterized protein LOC134177038 [Corticium candelabrum]|uniref:uncharacterized protein LOC134177038 n=1 Tax=Corticium candelabrum TaxID=121492 RepID=UPI002E27272A|nr:uncharacterized protein LOC134177038 [Corticium candelabrum]